MVNDEHGRFAGRILDDVFLFGDPDSEVRALAVRDLLFDMLRRQHTLKMTNGAIPEGFNVVADNQGVGIRLDPARSINDD